MTLEEATDQIQSFNGSARAEWMRDILRSYALHVVETARPKNQEPFDIGAFEPEEYNKALSDYHSAAMALIEKGV